MPYPQCQETDGTTCEACVQQECFDVPTTTPPPKQDDWLCSSDHDQCNTCHDCCYDYIPAGEMCNACAKQECLSKAGVLRCTSKMSGAQDKQCNVCPECCKDYTRMLRLVVSHYLDLDLDLDLDRGLDLILDVEVAVRVEVDLDLDHDLNHDLDPDLD
eukprot:gene57888-biopygen10175